MRDVGVPPSGREAHFSNMKLEHGDTLLKLGELAPQILISSLYMTSGFRRADESAVSAGEITLRISWIQGTDLVR